MDDLDRIKEGRRRAAASAGSRGWSADDTLFLAVTLLAIGAWISIVLVSPEGTASYCIVPAIWCLVFAAILGALVMMVVTVSWTLATAFHAALDGPATSTPASRPGRARRHGPVRDGVRFAASTLAIRISGPARPLPLEAGARCPTCADRFHGRAVVCTRCETPHHADCWEYGGGCAIYACASTAAARAAIERRANTAVA